MTETNAEPSSLDYTSSAVQMTKLDLLTSLLVFKAIYIVAVIVGIWYWSDFDLDNFNAVMQRWPRVGGPVFASHFATWDSAHYMYLSETGYHAGVESCAFFPLWP